MVCNELESLLYVDELFLWHMHPRKRIGTREWDGAIQFGTFNRLRMCPVLEVRSLPLFVDCAIVRVSR